MIKNLTVVITAFGKPEYLRETLESATLTQFEGVRLVVLDDASPNEYIKDICSDFTPRVEYIRNELNLGIAGNFNKAFQLTETQFLMIIGHDDVILESIQQILTKIDIDLDQCFGIALGAEAIDSSGNRSINVTDLTKKFLAPKKMGLYTGTKLKESLLYGNWTYFPGIVWNLKNIDRNPFSSDYQICMDWELLLRLSCTEKGLLKVSNTAMQYRRHAASASMASNAKSRFREEMKVQNKFLNPGRVNFKYRIFPFGNYLLRSFFERFRIITSLFQIK